MKVVKENLNPGNYWKIFTQNTKVKKSESMMLYIVGHDKWMNINVLPVMAKPTSYET
jgi:hypothetical protein